MISGYLNVIGQCPTAQFTVPSTLCNDQNFVPVNSSIDGDTFEWDFCEGDLSTTPTSNLLFRVSGANDIRGLEIVEDNGLWYGFLTNRGNDLIFRLDFGSSLDNASPTVTPLDIMAGLLDGPEPIHILKEGSNWFGVVHNGDGTTVTLIEFGTSLTNDSPDASNILTGVGGQNTAMEIAVDNGNTIMIFNTSGPKHLRINFGSSITNSVDITDVVDDGTITGITTAGVSIRDFQLINFCDQWYSVAVSFNGKKLYVLDYGSELFSKPTLTINENNIFNSESPYRIEVGVDEENFIALVSTTIGSVYRVPLGSDPGLLSSGLTATSLLDVGVNSETLYGFNLVKNDSEWRIFAINSALRDLYRLDFVNTCSSLYQISFDEDPALNNYSTGGSYSIGLKAKDSDGNVSYHTEAITVTSDIAPDIDFNNATYCISSPIEFISSSTIGGLSYSWDFGDASGSSDPNPSHTYSSSGDYQVMVTVNDGTCDNFTQQTITVYDEPVPDYSIPGGNICTNQNYTFTNTTPGDFDGLITYEWQLEGETVSTDEDLIITFTSGGSKELKLIASIPGCDVEIAKNLSNIKEGALPDFTFDDSCVGDLVLFTNSSSGIITDYSWDFGNGFTSTLENPQIQYSTSGEFEITLELTNTDGCITNDSKVITVHPLPTVDFEHDLACESLETPFTDQTLIAVDNLSSWSWDFDDGSLLNSDQNPTHLFESEGSYNVKLVSTSSFGCIDSLSKEVTVLPSPIADFTNDITCEDVEITFTDQSTPINGEAITAWGWNIGGVFKSSQNPTHTFSDPLSYNVSLTVTSENLCTSTLNRTITIPPKPTVTFSQSDNCENQITVLTDVTEIEGDEIIEWLWFYDGNEIGSLSEQLNSFDEGEYLVTLQVETLNGCTYLNEQTVTVYPAPTASFNTSTTFGAPPLDISFTNSSQGAISYSWNFKDWTTSQDENPTHTYDSLGEYNVELVALSAENCRDTANVIINVLEPINDLTISGLAIVESNGEEKISMAITNNGTIRYDSIKIQIDFEGEFTLNEKIMERLNPSESMTVQLDFGLTNKRLDYLCANVSSYFNLEEANSGDNSSCINFSNAQVIINPPFPNPATGLVSFDIIMQLPGNVDIEIIDSRGNVIDLYRELISEGPNTLTLDMSRLKEGVYFVSIRALNDHKKYRVALVN